MVELDEINWNENYSIILKILIIVYIMITNI